MSWKRIPGNKLPNWVKKKSKYKYLKGNTYLYKRKGKTWYKRLRNEWTDKTPWWIIFLITVAATIIATIIINLGYKIFN